MYKVLRGICGGLYSCMERREGEVRYDECTWVYPSPKCGPLCVFEKKEDAVNFITHHKQPRIYWELWECEIVQSDDDCVYAGDAVSQVKELPEGTVLADKVMITRRVWE